MANIVLINASGIGSRFGSDIPKQFHIINEKSIIYYCLNIFQRNKFINEIYVITKEEYFNEVYNICNEYHIDKFKTCIKGGNSANESRYNGLNNIICNKEDLIIMHDVVRVCIKDETINNLIKLGKEYGYAVCGQTINANIFTSNVDDSVIDIGIPSKKIFLNAMPFICRYDLLIESFNRGINKLDETAGPMGILANFCNIKVFPKIELDFIETFKITYREDIKFIEKFFI